MHGTHWWLQGAKSTLFMFGWQWVLSTAWHRQCAVVFGTSSHPSCPPDLRYSLSQLGLCSILRMCVYVCICMCLNLCTDTEASCLYMHFLARHLRYFECHIKQTLSYGGLYNFFFFLDSFYLYFFS